MGGSACASLFGSRYLFYERQQAVAFLWRALRMLPEGWMEVAAAESALPAAQRLSRVAVEQRLAGQLGGVGSLFPSLATGEAGHSHAHC